MTAPIVYYDVRHQERLWFPEHRFSADDNVGLNRSVPGELWTRLGEGKRRDG